MLPAFVRNSVSPSPQSLMCQTFIGLHGGRKNIGNTNQIAEFQQLQLPSILVTTTTRADLQAARLWQLKANGTNDSHFLLITDIIERLYRHCNCVPSLRPLPWCHIYNSLNWILPRHGNLSILTKCSKCFFSANIWPVRLSPPYHTHTHTLTPTELKEALYWTSRSPLLDK